MKPRHQTDRGRIYEARAEDVYPLIEPGSVQLVISDGPYFLNLAEWDKGKPEDAAEWYRPHIAAWDRICAPSASVYVWGTSASWAAVHPEMLAAGWRFRGLITWVKPTAVTLKADPARLRLWPDVTEVCGMYQREAFNEHAAGADERNWIRPWLGSEWDAAGLRRGEADTALGTNSMSSHYFGRSQWEVPTWEKFKALAAYAAEHGVARDRTYLVHPSSPSGLRATHEYIQREYSKLHAEYEAQRVPFSLPSGITNVWADPVVSRSVRLKGADGRALHPCEKRLDHVERIIRASSRPGALVLSVFSGTCREAVVCEGLSPSEARRYICIEKNEDGPDYIGPAIEELEAARSQGHLF